jgi:subtilisin family serine protease
MKKLFVLVAIIAFTVLTFFPAGTGGSAITSAAVKSKLVKKEKPIPNEYIVVLKDYAADPKGENSLAEYIANDLAGAHKGKVKKVYKHALHGFSITMSEADAVALSEDPRVEFVEEDGEVRATAVQTGAPWGLDRIDQRNRPLDGNYNYTPNGAGVHVYIIDTGIRTTHAQFGGRANKVFDAMGDGQGGNDCNGHGTHVAGTVGGSTYGVAKGVSLHAVRVLDCNGDGTDATVIAGVDWVTANRIAPAVANMSLGGGASSALDTAVQNSINAGVTYAIAAGNDYGTNACNTSPARVAAAITVGSTTSTDARSDFSNIGTCLDIFAPGSSIQSAWSTSDTATNTISGTSMATPHVAGVAALYLQNNFAASPATVASQIINTATTGVLTGIGTGSPNRLLYSLPTAQIQVTVQTNPPGRSFTVDGTTFVANQTFTWMQGSSHTIGTTSPQDGEAGTRFVWSGWSDGGAITHMVAPTSNTTYTANFTTQYFLTMNTEAGGTISPPSGWFNSGQSVSISAAPNGGFVFSGWSGAGAGSFTGTSNPASVTMNGPISETASFSGGRRNVALAANGATTTASSTFHVGHLPVAAINGDRRGLHWGADPATGSGWHDATADVFPDWLQVDFNSAKTIDEISVFAIQDDYPSPAEPTDSMTFTQYGITAFDVQYWDGSTWVTVPGGSVTGNNNVWRKFTFPAITVSKIRILVNSSLSAYTRIAEVEAFETNAPPRINVALAGNGGLATASSTHSTSFPASGVNNGDRKGLNWGAGGGWNDASPGSFPDWLQVDFSGTKTIDEISVFTIQDNYPNPVEPTDSMTFTQYGITAFDVQYWNGSTWVTVPGGSVTGNNNVWRKFTFNPVMTDSIRVLVDNSLSAYSRIAEVEAFETSVPPRINIALAGNGGQATASSTYDLSYPASGVNNGDRKGLNWGAGGGWNDASPGSFPDWVQIDFNGSKSIREIDVFTIQDNYSNPAGPTDSMTFTQYGITAFDVQYWNGSTWVTVPSGSVTGNNRIKRTFTFAPLTTDRVRVLVNNALASYSRLAEVEVY